MFCHHRIFKELPVLLKIALLYCLGTATMNQDVSRL